MFGRKFELPHRAEPLLMIVERDFADEHKRITEFLDYVQTLPKKTCELVGLTEANHTYKSLPHQRDFLHKIVTLGLPLCKRNCNTFDLPSRNERLLPCIAEQTLPSSRTQYGIGYRLLEPVPFPTSELAQTYKQFKKHFSAMLLWWHTSYLEMNDADREIALVGVMPDSGMTFLIQKWNMVQDDDRTWFS